MFSVVYRVQNVALGGPELKVLLLSRLIIVTTVITNLNGTKQKNKCILLLQLGVFAVSFKSQKFNVKFYKRKVFKK